MCLHLGIKTIQIKVINMLFMDCLSLRIRYSMVLAKNTGRPPISIVEKCKCLSLVLIFTILLSFFASILSSGIWLFYFADSSSPNKLDAQEENDSIYKIDEQKCHESKKVLILYTPILVCPQTFFVTMYLNGKVNPENVFSLGT